jgi:hypothetical protein
MRGSCGCCQVIKQLISIPIECRFQLIIPTEDPSASTCCYLHCPSILFTSHVFITFKVAIVDLPLRNLQTPMQYSGCFTYKDHFPLRATCCNSMDRFWGWRVTILRYRIYAIKGPYNKAPKSSLAGKRRIGGLCVCEWIFLTHRDITMQPPFQLVFAETACIPRSLAHIVVILVQQTCPITLSRRREICASHKVRP